MHDRSAFVTGGNLGLSVLVATLVLAAGLAWIGPARSLANDVIAELEQKLARNAEWFANSDRLRPADEKERQQWRDDFASTQQIGLLDADEPALMARVAALFSGASVRGLEVARSGDDGQEAAGGLSLQEPEGQSALELRRLPLQVRLRSNYADLRKILERIEGDRGPLRIDRIDLRRDFPGVRVDAQLTLWIRREVAA